MTALARLFASLVLCVLPARAIAVEEVLLFAAASLTDALSELGKQFEATSRDMVTYNFGASSDLARQIKAGAPADVVFSADAARMDELVAAGLVEPTARRDVLSNVLAVVVPKGSTLKLASADDLRTVKRLALANPESVPAGVYARQWLQSKGLWDAVRDRVVPTQDVRGALAAVANEHADAGIVYRTDAAISPKVRVAFDVPRAEGPPIVYVLAPIAASKKAGTAAFVAHLTSPAANEVYRRFGFLVLH